jgi:hypothetical protein
MLDRPHCFSSTCHDHGSKPLDLLQIDEHSLPTSFSKKEISRIWVCHDVCPDQSPKSGEIFFQVLGLGVYKETHHRDNQA